MTRSTTTSDITPENDAAAHRVRDVEAKHRLVAEFLREHRFDALLLQRPANFAWFTSGADNTRGGGPETTAAVFVTPNARVIVTNSIDSVQLFEVELPELGFQLKQRAWHESNQTLIDDLCRGRTVASDGLSPGTRNISAHLTGMRLPLTELEAERMRELGKRVVHSVEATARNAKPGRTEAEMAAELAHRLVKRRVVPVRMQVAGDGRADRFRHWSFGSDRVERSATISAIGQWHGLYLGVTRTFSFETPSNDLRESHNRAVLMLATGAAFSRHDWELCEVWKRVKRIYEKFEVPGEWQLARQAEITGFSPTEVPVIPQSEFRLNAGMPVFWHPSVGPAAMGDTVLVTEAGVEWLTPTEHWPRLAVDVKGMVIQCPDILVRGSADQPQTSEAESLFDSAMSISDESGSEFDLSAVLVE